MGMLIGDKESYFEENFNKIQKESEVELLFGTNNENLKPKSDILNYKDKGIECYKIELTKEIALDLLRGVSASFQLFSHPLIKGCFDYSDQYGRFDWKSEVKELIGHSPDISDAIAYRLLFLITRKK